MSLESIKDLVTSKAARQILLTQKHSPKILFVAGTVGVVTATVLACRATLKVSDVLDEHETTLSNIGALDRTELMTEEDVTRSTHKRQIKTAVDIAKLYAPAIGLGVVSIAALTGSHVILSKRNGAVMAAYAAVDRAYKEYRQRVSDEYGQDVDRKFASGSDNVLVEEKTSDGKTKTTVGTAAMKDRPGKSPYGVIFDQQSHKFSKEPGRNAMTLQMNQNYANDKLRANGHLFLNEVHDMLGLPRTKAGAVVGWVHRHDSEEKTGDNYVSFGIYDGDLERAEAFVEGIEDCVWLDFNVDGIILDLI